MGSSSSKVARKFPTRAPGAAVSEAASRSRPEPRQPRTDGSTAARADATDPDSVTGDFSRRLHQMGIAEPNPTFSPSSTASSQPSDEMPPTPLGPVFPSAKHNATLSVLEARRRLQQRADEDLENMGRSGGAGRRFLDMRTLVDAIQLQRNGHPAAAIEKRFGLEPNLLSKLGRPGLLSHVSNAH